MVGERASSPGLGVAESSCPAKRPLGVFAQHHKLAIIEEEYSPWRLIGSTLLAAAFTGVAEFLRALFPELVPCPGAGLRSAWILVALHPAASLATGWALRTHDERRFRWLFTLQHLLRAVWIQAVCWGSNPMLWAVSLTFMTAWLFHDVWLLGFRRLCLAYAAIFPGFDLWLLAHDVLGRDGLAWAWRTHPSATVSFLIGQVLLTSMMFTFMRRVEEESDARDRALAEQKQAEGQLESLHREHEVVRRSCAFMATGLTASKFSHDVASPVMGLLVNVGMLREALAREQVGADAQEVLDDIEAAAEALRQMTHRLASSVNHAEVLEPRPVSAPVEQAIEFARRAVHGTGSLLEPSVRLVDTPVWVSDEHESSIGNVLANCALHSGIDRLDVSGRPVTDHFYALLIRDYGVKAANRERVMSRVRASLALEPHAHASEHRGYGIGLMLARLHLVRTNGDIGVRAPDEGDGLEFWLVLPRTLPSLIPETENRPDAVLMSLLSPGAGPRTSTHVEPRPWAPAPATATN